MKFPHVVEDGSHPEPNSCACTATEQGAGTLSGPADWDRGSAGQTTLPSASNVAEKIFDS